MKYLLLLAGIAGLAACNQTGSQGNREDGLASLNMDSLTRHIITLSSDSFQGRRPVTVGETRTIDYLEHVYKSMGVEPGNGGNYLQEVPMVEITPECDPVMNIQSPKEKLQLKNMDDYVIWTEKQEPVESLLGDEVVFAGFGIVAPEYNWNDYAGIDVHGKVVMVLVNDPGYGSDDSTFFKGNTMTYYGRWTYKFEEAARQGAKACLVVHNTAAAAYPFSVVQNSWSKGHFFLDKRNDKKEYRCAVQGWITGDAARKLLIASNGDTSLLTKAHQKGFKAVPLNLKVNTTMKVQSQYVKSNNVVAKITGSKRPDEFIIYTAHWDHFGIGKPDATGDSIYNGALDNASGTAALIELARAFKSLKTPPERTIVFLTVTGEEQGLLGSGYYAEHPVYPLINTVADINIDGMNNHGKTRDAVISGEGQSDLEDIYKDLLKDQKRYVAPESHPEAGGYFRSDHFSFAKYGVPSLNAGGGIDLVEGGKVKGKMFQDEFTAKHYHKPSDQYDAATWNLAGAMQDIDLYFLLGKKLAFDTSWPKWKKNSEFKDIRKQRQ